MKGIQGWVISRLLGLFHTLDCLVALWDEESKWGFIMASLMNVFHWALTSCSSHCPSQSQSPKYHLRLFCGWWQEVVWSEESSFLWVKAERDVGGSERREGPTPSLFWGYASQRPSSRPIFQAWPAFFQIPFAPSNWFENQQPTSHIVCALHSQCFLHENRSLCWYLF